MRMPTVRNLTLLICLSTGIGAVLYAQGTYDGSTHDPLLEEIRALRTEINQVAAVSIRMQLFVARLQLQEQRVVMAGRQLTEVQNSLSEVRSGIAGEKLRVEQLEKSMTRSSAQGQAQLQQAIAEAKTGIEQQEKRQQELQRRERELLNLVNDEQARWSDFNDRLDALERSLPPSASR